MPRTTRPGEVGLLGSGQRMEAASVNVAIQPLDVGAPCVPAAGHLQRKAHRLDDRLGRHRLAAQLRHVRLAAP